LTSAFSSFFLFYFLLFHCTFSYFFSINSFFHYLLFIVYILVLLTCPLWPSSVPYFFFLLPFKTYRLLYLAPGLTKKFCMLITLHLWVLYGSRNKQDLLPCTSLTGWFL
jgi:hypothetical protein